jgi:tetratricopeptide (TPR) repeat protein
MKLARYYLSIDAAQAEKIIDDYNSLKEDDYEGMSIKSAILNNKKEHEEAFAMAEKLIELYPNKANGYLQTVPYYALETETQKAITVLEKGYEVVEDNRSILMVLTSVQASTSPDVVIERIKNELKASPEDMELKLLLAKVYIAEKVIDQATPLLVEVVENDYEQEEPYILLSAIHAENKDLDSGEAVLLRGVKNVPSSLKIPFNLTSIYEHKKDYVKSIEVYRRLIEVHPDHPIVQNNYASILSDHGDGKGDLELAFTVASKLFTVADELLNVLIQAKS